MWKGIYFVFVCWLRMFRIEEVYIVSYMIYLVYINIFLKLIYLFVYIINIYIINIC